jgi:WD40 repeat protein
MTYCFNPDCQQSQNPDDARFCQNCGKPLWLGDRYRAVKVIGQGGFGKTFLAVDQSNPALPYCVVKQSLPLRQLNLSSQQTADLFCQEAERLAELGTHPQIPRLWEHFAWQDSQYLVQEHIDGQNLEVLLAEEKTFSEERVRQVLQDLLPVLRFVHGHQVIHRDIKPENIICPQQSDKLVLVDFGASKFVTETMLVRTGTLIGSAGYVAPEQAMGKAEFSSDLYSLGVTCIHLLTGLHPFDLYSISEDAWVWTQYLAQPVSYNLRQVLDKLLQKATSRRYRTATAVLQDLGLEGSSALIASYRPPSPAPATQSEPPSPAVLPQWACQHTLIGHIGAITAIALHPQAPLLASGSSDKTIKLWDIQTGELLHNFAERGFFGFSNGHSDRITGLQFTPDGQTLISSSSDGQIKLWEIPSCKPVTTLPEAGWGISAIALSRDGRILAGGSNDGSLHLWNLGTLAVISNLSSHQDQVSGLLLSPKGQTLISSSHDKTICLWSVNRRCLLKTINGHLDRVSAIAITPDWQILVSASWDRQIKLWDLVRAKPLRNLAGHSDRISCLAISPDGHLLASAGEDSTIKLWSISQTVLTRPQTLRPMTIQHGWGINALCFSPDSQTLVSGSTDETIKIWRLVGLGRTV